MSDSQLRLFPQPSFRRSPPAKHYPAGPGAKERGGTSVQAAQTVAFSAEQLRGRVLECLQTHGPLTADEITDLLGEDLLNVRPRCTELIQLGVVEKTAQRRKNTRGNSTRVLVAVKRIGEIGI